MQKTAQQSKTDVTPQESLTLVRNLLRTAVSSISYLRNLFPEDCFLDRTISGIQIKSLLPTHPESRMLIDWLEKGVFDALKKKYLKRLIFGVSLDPNDESTMIESYEFKITYPNDMAQLNFGKTSEKKRVGFNPQSKTEITQSMMIMIRTLITLSQTLKPIPETRYITMKLLYYDDVTPHDYEPAFFRAASEDESRKFHTDRVKLKIGNVTTKYHMMNIKVRTSADMFDCGEGEVSTSTQEETEKENDTKEESDKSKENVDLQENSCEDESNKSVPMKEDDKKNIDEDDDETDIDDDSTEIDEPTTNPLEEEALEYIEDCSKDYLRALVNVLNEEAITVRRLARVLKCTSHQARKHLIKMAKDSIIEKQNDWRKERRVLLTEKKQFFLNAALTKLDESNASDNNKPKAMDMEENSPQSPIISQVKPDGSKKVQAKSNSNSKTERKNSNTTENEETEKERGVKRKIAETFEVSMSQDSLNLNNSSQSQRKVSVVQEPIEQKRRRIYRDPNEIKW